MDLKSLSLTQRLAAGCGCVVLLAAGAAGVLFGIFEYRSNARIRREIEQAPSGWAARLRAYARPPDLTGMRLERTDSGDAASAALDSARAWRRPGIETAYRAMMGGGAGGGGAASSVDSTIWRLVGSDTALDRFVTLARRREWRALDRMLSRADTAAHRNVLALGIPLYGDLRNAGRGLVVRAMMRLRPGDRAGARTDLGAAVALGEQLFRREPTLVGAIVGRSMIASGANGWQRYAVTVGDTALAARARAVRAWGATPPGAVAELLLADPDTALAIARDTSLVLGMRAEGLSDVLLGFMVRPRGSLFGVPGRYQRAIAALAADRDPDLARLAAMTAATAERVHVLGLATLLREAQPGAR